MQTVTGWPTDTDVTTPSAIVTVSGSSRAVESVRISRELGGALPAQVVGGSGITAADGSVSWAESDDVVTVPAVPWLRRGAWPPSPGQSCIVSAGYGTAQARLLTGLTTDTNGSFGSTDLSTGFEDRIAKLNRVLSFDPLLAAMPSIEDGAVSRYIGLNASYITDQVLRECGFYAQPKMMSGAVVSAPMNGSTWPERGVVTYSLSTVAGSAFPDWMNAPWGLAVQGVDARYTPSFPSGENGFLTKPMEMVVQIPSDSSGAFNFYVYWGANAYRLAVTASMIYGQKLVAGTTTVASLIRGSARTVVLRLTPDGAGNVGMELRTNTGGVSTGTTPIIAGTNTTPLTQVTITGAGSFAGVQVGFPTTAFEALAHVPSAVITVNASSGRRNVLIGMPAIVSRTGLSILREQADAECACMWIDAYGVFRWIDRETIVSKPAVTMLGSRDSLLDAAWSDTAAHVRSQVKVQWREPLTSRSAWASISVQMHEGSGETLKSGAELNSIIHPGADEDWIMVDTAVEKNWPGFASRFNSGIGSWVGAVLDNGDSVDNDGNLYITAFMRKIDPRTYLINHVAGTIPAGYELQLRTHTNPESALWTRWRGVGLPIIRAKARIDWADRTTVGSPAGPVDAEVLTHDAGWWVQDASYAQRLADYLAAQTSTPAPLIDGLEIIPDPRIELGDVVAVDDRTRSGIYLTGLVSAVSIDVSEANMSMSLKLRIITADTASGVTYADFTASRPAGETYDQFQTASGTKTYAQFQAAPLAI